MEKRQSEPATEQLEDKKAIRVVLSPFRARVFINDFRYDRKDEKCS